jgi:hypothetical protein
MNTEDVEFFKINPSHISWDDFFHKIRYKKDDDYISKTFLENKIVDDYVKKLDNEVVNDYVKKVEEDYKFVIDQYLNYDTKRFQLTCHYADPRVYVPTSSIPGFDDAVAPNPHKAKYVVGLDHAISWQISR